MKYLVFTGGGTGGHVFPGLAVAEKFQSPADVKILWLGSAKGIEKNLVEESGLTFVEFRPIPAGKLRRYLSLQNFSDLFRILGAFFVCISIFIKIKPAVVFSKGGFVTVPPVWAAGLLKIPVISHESDFDPGLATRLNMPFSTKILVAYDQTVQSIPAKYRPRVRVTGNPIRSKILSGRADEVPRYFPGISWGPKKPLILVLGGSLGAVQLNDLVVSILGKLEGRAVVVHQHGNQWTPPEEREGHYYPRAFLGPELPGLLATADFALARAGAGTLWELAAKRIPGVLVPLTAGSRGDQIRNARFFEATGAVRVLIDPESREFEAAIEEFMNSDFREQLRHRYTALPSDASGAIADHIREEMRE